MQKIIAIILISSMMLFLFSCGYEGKDEDGMDSQMACKDGVEFIEESSFFDDFYIADDQVELFCYIYIQNHTLIQQTIQIQGDFLEDWESGLLSERILLAQNLDTGESLFDIPPGESRIHLVFRCDYGGGTTQKQNRLLPQISVLCITDTAVN